MTADWPELDDALLARLDQPGPRYTSYPTVPEWSPAFGQGGYLAALERASTSDAPLSVYVHVPFCREMCGYCGCNVVVSKDATKGDRYLDALARELTLVADRLGGRRRLSRLHLGGGTPTWLDERQLARLWDILTARLAPLPDAELAIEVDPSVTRTSQLELLAGFGFNRLSMGVQDFDPGVQRAIGRLQGIEVTQRTVEAARALGFGSVNFDLIYGLPGQTPDSWRRTLDQVITLAPDRIAAFSFAYLPALKPHQRRLPVAAIPSPRRKLDLLRRTRETLGAAGYRAIGMDHFACREDELARAADRGLLWRDFQGYTTQRAADTLALGVSAIGYLGDAFTQNTRSLLRYQRELAAGRLPVERGHRLDDDDRLRRDVITQLMCNGRVDLAPWRDRFPAELVALRAHAADGLCTLSDATVELTPLGKLFVRNVAMTFDSYLAAHDGRSFSRTV